MANHRALGRAHVRALRTSSASHRDSAVRAGVLKVGVLGALATATIAFPLASATAGGQSSPLPSISSGQGVAQAAPATSSASQLAPVSLGAASAASHGADRDGVDSAEGPQAATGLSVKASANAQTVKDMGGESSEGFIHPVDARITSGYGERVHPVLGTAKMHDGVDFGAACGADVHAAAAGTVVAVESNSASGNRVKVDHGDGVITGYYHLSSFSASVGDDVEQGDVLGKVGSTGRSTGCHLHFSKLDEAGTYSNPMSLFR